MTIRTPGLEPKQHEIDRIQISLRELCAQEAVRFNGGVYAHESRTGEQLHDESPLHQRLTATHGEAAGFDKAIFEQAFVPKQK